MGRQCWAGIVVAGAMLAGPVSAADEEAYEACMLQHLKHARTDYAAALVKQACDNLHNRAGLLFSDDEKYYRCILENIPGLESDRAVENVRHICREQSERR